MEEAREPVEIQGFVFARTGDGHLLESEVRQHLTTMAERLDALQRESAELRGRLDHVVSLERLAQATVIKADELAAEIEARAREHAEEMRAACERELAERRRQFEVEQLSELTTARERAAQLQAALEGTLQTLARALQTAGAPALELPPPAPPAPAAPTSAEPASGEVSSQAPSPPPPAAVPEPREAAPEPASASAAVKQVSTHEAAAPADLNARPSGAEQPAMPGQTDVGAGAGASAVDHELMPEPPLRAEEVAAPAAPDVREAVTSAPLADAAPAPAAASAPPDAVPTPAPPPPLSPATTELPAAPFRFKQDDRTDEVPAMVPAEQPPAALARSGPQTIEIDMRPVKSFADLARVTKLLGGIAPGAQPVDLNLPQHRALFSVRGRDPAALAAQLQEALPDAKVVERDKGLDVLLEGP